MTAPTLRQVVEGMVLGFDPDAAAGGAAVLEFEAAEERPRLCHLVVAGGSCRFASGPAADATLRLRTDGATWRAIGAGELDAVSAMASGTLRADGDASALLQLQRWFRRIEPAALRVAAGRPPGAVRLRAMAWMAVAFVPWKALWLGLLLQRPRAGVLAGLLASGLLLAYRRASGAATFFEAATTMAFAAAALLGVDGLGRPAVLSASLAALAAIWALGAAVRPLGLSGEYSRWNYVPSLWGTALFRHPNVVVTLAWAGAFLANAGLASAERRWHVPGAVAAALHVALFAGCAVFTRRQERGARERRVDDIDRRLSRWRRLAWAVVVLAALLLAAALAR